MARFPPSITTETANKTKHSDYTSHQHNIDWNSNQNNASDLNNKILKMERGYLFWSSGKMLACSADKPGSIPGGVAEKGILFPCCLPVLWRAL